MLLSVVWSIACVVYGIVATAAFAYFILLSTATYCDMLKDKFPDEFMDFLLFDYLSMLGVGRMSVWVVIALLWPISLAVIGVYAFVYRDYDPQTQEFSLPMQILQWALLGFGKFKPRQEEPVNP